MVIRNFDIPKKKKKFTAFVFILFYLPIIAGLRYAGCCGNHHKQNYHHHSGQAEKKLLFEKK